MSDSDSLDFDPSRFLIPNGLWFIMPDCRGLDLRAVCEGLLRTRLEDGEALVVAFTDSDLAARYLERGGEAARPYAAGKPRTRQAILDFLEALLLLGETHMYVDPEPTHGERHSIAVLVRQIRALPDPQDSGAEG